MDYLTGICFLGPLLLIIPVGLVWLGLTAYVRFAEPADREMRQVVPSCSLVVGSVGVMLWCLIGALLREWVVRGVYPSWVALSRWYFALSPRDRLTAIGFGLVAALGGGVVVLAVTVALAVWGWRWYATHRAQKVPANRRLE